jgi:anti-sigma factor RsiW
MEDISDLLHQHREELRYRMPAHLRQKLVWKRPPLVRRIAPLAAAASIAFVAGWFVHQPAVNDTVPQEVVSGHVRSLMAGHLTDVPSTDRHTVKPWFEGRLDFGPDVRDFPERGFVLEGGRLDYVDSRSAAALVYKRGQHVINLYEWPSPGTGTSPPRLSTRRGFQIFSWQRDGIAYWAVSDLNAAELQQFAELWQ